MRLLDAAAGVPGARVERLDVVLDGDAVTSLRSAADLASIEDLDRVRQIIQHTRFADRAELRLVMSAAGIEAGVRGASPTSPARGAAEAVREEYSTMRLRPTRPRLEDDLQKYSGLPLGFGVGLPLFFWADALGTPVWVQTAALVGVGTAAGVFLSIRLGDWITARMPHWLGTRRRSRILPRLVPLIVCVAVAVMTIRLSLELP